MQCILLRSSNNHRLMWWYMPKDSFALLHVKMNTPDMYRQAQCMSFSARSYVGSSNKFVCCNALRSVLTGYASRSILR